ncbi:putative MATE family efflux protein [Enterococcus sp. PF1-24]|uniref:MATE family efflux transporter n=1 Tax=unclassified Enterococcus TaxID=2608891 RepID=UPI002475B2EF|nr:MULTISPECIES: MATE family efflux transporter [unclassified Enterococcus]MDH6365442.1 putative MATE family efflux protein [Enterococcus sp. PFB1-1]MDH6402543.1 putative MATE family efflux protein [Enterococcus sp. PF1-24]
MAKDMTKGSIVKTLLNFTLPLIMSGLLQQLFNWVDAFIVGNIEGELALAAIGSTGSIYNVFIMVIVGFTSGLAVLAAQQYGLKQFEKLKGNLTTFTILLGGICLVIVSLGIIFSKELLTALATPLNIFQLADSYLKILLVGMPFLTVYNVYSAILRGMGDSQAPFLAILVSSVANVALDFIFVGILHYGVAGAAVATMISQVLMTLFIMIYSWQKYPQLRFSFKEKLINQEALVLGLRFGAPLAIQSGVSSMGNLLLQRFMNGFGELTVAAITTAYRVDSVILLPIINLGSGLATVVGQNIGSGNDKRARKALVAGGVMLAVVSIALTGVVLLIGGPLIAMFGLTTEAIVIGKRFFFTIASFYLIYGLATAFRGYLEGMGDMVFSGVAGIVALITRIIASYSFADYFGDKIIAYAEAFSWVVLLILYVLRFWQKGRVRKEVIIEEI